MKKVAVVSCYFQPNYGSMLQAFATQKALDELGYENETIDISGLEKEIRAAKLKYFAKASLTSGILAVKMGRALDTLTRRIGNGDYTEKQRQRRECFRTFEKKNFRLSEPFSSREDLTRKCEEKYTSVLVGSDQLWLPANIAADYYTLSFVPANVNTIAYATSFGVAKLPADAAKRAKVFLKKIRHISVRETSGQRLVEELTGREVPVVCDPTLLFTGDEWLQIQKKEPVAEGKYIFCYFLGNNAEHRKFASRLKAATGCKIVALIHVDEYVKADVGYADETPWKVDPADFLNLIRNAEYVCTDSFHCTAFSILYHRPFFTFRRFSEKTAQSTNSRLDTLLSATGLEDRLMTGDENVTDYLASTIDFNATDNRLNSMRDVSYEYLRNALKDEITE